jgi:hypothetical protein
VGWRSSRFDSARVWPNKNVPSQRYLAARELAWAEYIVSVEWATRQPPRTIGYGDWQSPICKLLECVKERSVPRWQSAETRGWRFSDQNLWGHFRMGCLVSSGPSGPTRKQVSAGTGRKQRATRGPARLLSLGSPRGPLGVSGGFIVKVAPRTDCCPLRCSTGWPNDHPVLLSRWPTCSNRFRFLRNSSGIGTAY